MCVLAWDKVTSSATGPRVCLLFCYDGIQAHKKAGSVSLVPAEFCMLSFPPHQRYKAENMLLYLLLKNSLSAKQQRKYFTYVVKDELADLHTNGINGMIIRVFGALLDLRAKEKFLNQRYCTGYYGCHVCTEEFFPGFRTKVCFCAARRWLPRTSRLRNEFQDGFDFICAERRGPPPLRTTKSVYDACALVSEEGLNHYMGKWHG